MVKIEKESAYKKLNGTMSGEEFRQWRANIYDEASGYTDESASSLADYFDDNDIRARGVMTRRSGCARRSAAARVHVTWQECRPVACADGRPGRREGRVRPPTGERDEMADGPGASVCG